ncbi:hypothetical protein D3C72_1750870 [compost metagenome]
MRSISRRATRSISGSSNPSTNSICTSGARSCSVAMARGNSTGAADRMVPICRRPATPALTASISSPVRAASPSTRRAYRHSAPPASVNANVLPRVNSGVPTRSSISLNQWDSAGCVMCMALAAAVTVPAFSRAIRTSRWRSFSRRVQANSVDGAIMRKW